MLLMNRCTGDMILFYIKNKDRKYIIKKELQTILFIEYSSPLCYLIVLIYLIAEVFPNKDEFNAFLRITVPRKDELITDTVFTFPQTEVAKGHRTATGDDMVRQNEADCLRQGLFFLPPKIRQKYFLFYLFLHGFPYNKKRRKWPK